MAVATTKVMKVAAMVTAMVTVMEETIATIQAAIRKGTAPWLGRSWELELGRKGNTTTHQNSAKAAKAAKALVEYGFSCCFTFVQPRSWPR